MDALPHILAQLVELNEKLDRLIPSRAAPIDWSQGIAFRWQGQDKSPPLVSIRNPHRMALEDLLCIDHQKTTLVMNTRQFLQGLPCNNALLWGSRGTGKSSLVKAILSEFSRDNLRVIEVNREHLIDLPIIQEILVERSERFILFCDDLAFETDDAGYKALKALLEGSLCAQPDNVLIYATSNRRHLLPEYVEENLQARWINDELHQGEASEEKISLSERFGVWLSFRAFSQDQYLEMVAHWLEKLGRSQDLPNAREEALSYALFRGSRSGRVALQFAKDWVGRTLLKPKMAL